MENESHELNTDSLVGDFSRTMRGYFQANPPFDKSSVLAAFVFEFPTPGWVCRWKPFWILVGESFKKAYLEECGCMQATTLETNKDLRISLHSCRAQATKVTYVMVHLQHPDRPAARFSSLGTFCAPG